MELMDETEALDVTPLVELLQLLHALARPSGPASSAEPRHGSASTAAGLPATAASSAEAAHAPPVSDRLLKWEKEARSVYGSMALVSTAELDAAQRDKVSHFQAATGCEVGVAVTLLR